MYQRKQLKDLTLKDNFMFCAVMSDPENCRPLLERILGKEIGRVTVDREKCLIYNPKYKSVRMDVYAKDEQNTHYNVEMQVAEQKDLPRRARYYHSQLDMELLNTGTLYGNLPDSFVIFICDFDPFGKEKYCYFMQQYCRESKETVDDGSCTVFLNTCGKNKDEVSGELSALLDYIHSSSENTPTQSKDPYVMQLQTSIRQIKQSREMGGHFMLFTEMLEEEYQKGKKAGYDVGYDRGEKCGYDRGEKAGYDRGEKAGYDRGEKAGYDKGEKTGKVSAICSILSDKGIVTEEVHHQLLSADTPTLDNWLKAAIAAKTPEEFLVIIRG